MTADREGERFRWRHAIICGLLGGVVVLLAVSLVQPVGDLDLPDLLVFMSYLRFHWCCVGLVWACGAKLAEDTRRPRLVLPLVLLCAWIVGVGVAGPNPLMPGSAGHLSRAHVLDLAVYDLWVNLFYGGFYALGFLTIRRTQALRRRLAAVRLSRNEAESRLREARLQAVRGQMQPGMLLEALAVLRRVYAEDRQAGDRLFDLLIAFLRAAMPGLRSGTSTLAAELAVIDRYAVLREALLAGPPVWRLALETPPADLPFPPLRLLPALDRLSRSTPPDAEVEVTASPDANAFVVRIGAPSPRPLPLLLLQRLRSAIRQDLGLGAMMAAEAPAPLIAELHVGPPGGPPPRAA